MGKRTFMIIHVVKSGETLNQIAREYGVSVESIIENNHLRYPENLVVGQTIVIMLEGEAARPWGNIWVNGYAYPYINTDILSQAFPSLTYITIFGYGFTEEGSLIKPDEQKEQILIQRAYENNTMPVFLLSSLSEDGTFSSEKASLLFQNPDLQEKVLQNIIIEMQKKGYQKLDLDFEYIPPEDKQNYIDFIRHAVQMLHPFGFPVQVDLAPKTSDTQQGLLYEAHDYKSIGEIADTVLLMTYEWGYTYGSPMAVAPINKVEEVVSYAVGRIDNRKIYMGIPNYGYDWALPFISGVTRAKTIGNEEAVALARTAGAEIQFDTTAMSPYFYYRDVNNIEHVVWFEDARSIYAKLSIIAKYNLLGAGYWNLMRPFVQNWLVLNNLYAVIKI